MIQPQQISWEPVSEGITFRIAAHGVGKEEESYDLAMTTVRELQADMEEANFLARGYEKVDCMVSEIYDSDRIVLGGDTYKITDILTRAGEFTEEWILQFELNAYSMVQSEIILPGDLQITVWRAVQ
jgi:hypothetical protein